jgi:serine/threonine protein kinase
VARNPARIGRYELVTALAVGGMGRIFLGKFSGLGGFERKVVIKTLEVPVDTDTDPAIAMFLDEARLLGLLHHQHIATVFEVGRDNDGRHYIVLDYVDGYSAHDVWERANEFGAALPLDFTLTVVSAAANGLHYTHTRKDDSGRSLGIVHRDVTPSNVMIGHDGAVKLIDFGIAMAANRTTKTQTGFVKGKVGYLSPEQVGGYDVDARTDVFALGILLYELSTLQRAFRENNDLATMQRIKVGDVVRPSLLVNDYLPELEEIVMKALQVNPRDRFADADAMRRAIEALGHRLHFVLGDAAVIEVMAQLYDPQEPGANRPPTRVSDPSLEWAECDHDLTVRRDPQELLEAMRAASAELGEAATMRPSVPALAATVRPRKLRAATEAADALIVGSSDSLPMVFTPPTPLPVVGRPAAAKPAATEPVAAKLVTAEPVSEVTGELTEVTAEPGAGKPVTAKPASAAKPASVAKPATAKPGKPATPTNPKIGANLVQARTQRSSRLRWIGAIAVLGVLGGVGYVVTRDSGKAVAGSKAPPVPAPTAPHTPEVAASPPPLPAHPAPVPPPAPTRPPEQSKVRVRVVTHPGDATVLLDGKKLGHTPLDEKVTVEPGKHVMKLRHRGYVTQVLEVELGSDISQDVTLAPQSPQPSSPP